MSVLRIVLLAEEQGQLQCVADVLRDGAPDHVVMIKNGPQAWAHLVESAPHLLIWGLPPALANGISALHQLVSLPLPPAVAFFGASTHLDYLERECQFLKICYLGHYIEPLSHTRVERMLAAVRLCCVRAAS